MPLTAKAQGEWAVRGDCTPDLAADGTTRGIGRRQLPAIRQDWDASRVYRQMVILVSFRDVDFSYDDPAATFNAMFNEPGYSQRRGVGCVADYFREQSGGRFNLAFDVYGPVKVDTLACPYTSPNDKTRNYGREQFRLATVEVLSQHPDVDYSQYDWNGDGQIEQIIYVYAGLSGNQGDGSYGHIWPNTGSYTSLTVPGGLRVSNFTASGELWRNNLGNCGIGTICHEFSHSLGLPDIYPTGGDGGYSVVDEWDLMDGGNFTNYGWCPPDYSPLEKMLFGWLTPVELTEPASISGMKPLADGGVVYVVKNSDTDYYLLENRQWRGWSIGVPGHGLVVYHVNYKSSKWSGNTVNNDRQNYGYELLHADGLDYDGWDDLLMARGARTKYANSGRMNCLYLSTSAYPWPTDSTATVDRTPDGMALDISNIRETDDGLVSFDFRGGNRDAISEAEAYYNSIKDSNPAAAAALLEAINAAKAVKDNVDATQEQVDAAIAALERVKTTAEDTVLKETKTALNDDITEAEAYYNSIKDSNPAAAAALLEAINAAKAVKDNADTTQEQVDAAIVALAGAKTTAEDTVLTGIKTELNDAISAARLPQTLGDAWFDLQGRRVAGRPARGLYISNGRKAILH